MTRCLVWASTQAHARQIAQDEGDREVTTSQVPWEDQSYTTCVEVLLDQRPRLIDKHRTNADLIRKHGAVYLPDDPDGAEWIDDYDDDPLI